MPALEQVDGHEDGEQVHVGRVELEVHVRRAKVVARRHDADHGKGETHRVEEREGSTGSSLVDGLPVGFGFGLGSGKLPPQPKNSWPRAFGGWFLTHLLQFSPQDDVLLHEGDEEEEKPKEHVAHIAQDVIPHYEAYGVFTLVKIEEFLTSNHKTLTFL